MDRDLHDETFIDRSAGIPSEDRSQPIASRERPVPPQPGRAVSVPEHRPGPDGRSVYELRDKSYRLNHLEAQMLRDIGTFGAIDKTYLLDHVYKGTLAAFDRDLRHLHKHSLVRIVGPKGSVTKYLVLTKQAQELTEKHLRTNPGQQIYYGARKVRELKHDATLYRLYQQVAREMEERGEKPVRVVLDYELKRNINKALAKTKDLSWHEKQQRIRELAEKHKLKVVNAKIPLPDLRIEYERADGSEDLRDLEYITEHYRARSFAEKAAAGFALYGDHKKGHKPHGPDLIGGLIAL